MLTALRDLARKLRLLCEFDSAVVDVCEDLEKRLEKAEADLKLLNQQLGPIKGEQIRLRELYGEHIRTNH